ncbi:type VII secretion target [Nocardia sp. CA-135398]|uniref:type VII secretion target n=1 Tax=Nocardia sp. CA-135398 TaxID=3239977 RepID=UPI003D971462
MPEGLVVEPEELRQIAKQHELAAANLRKWGEIPHAWLAEFKDTYGTIADPMRWALIDYYNARHDRAERLALNHLQTRDQLLAAASALEERDQAGGRQVSQSGGDNATPGGSGHGAPPDPVRPVYNGPDTPIMNGTLPGQPSMTAPDTSSMPDGTPRSDQAPLSPAASAPQGHDTLPTGGIAPIGTTSPTMGVPEYSADMSAAAAGDSSGPAGPAGGSDLVGGMPAPLMTGPYPATVDPAGAGAGLTARSPAPLATGPFAAAVHSAEDRRALPSFVVGMEVADDLALARILLSATLAAVADSARGVEWAVIVGRDHAGPVVFLTSTEGRGWLPPGLFLPLEVCIPWRWDAALPTAGQNAFAALEGTSDPARVLAEFGLMVGRRRNGVWISALVSSAAIPDGVRAAVGADTAIEEWVSPAESAVDFTVPGPGLVDRLALAGSDELLRQAVLVPETEIRAKCLELAQAADAMVRAAFSGVDSETSIRRARRQRILDALHAGQPVPMSWWDQMRAADDVTASELWSRRVDVSSVPVGGVSIGVFGTDAVRSMVFERRADELLLLLAAGEPDRQVLRDVLYTYGQITEHPLLPEAARKLATGTIGAGTGTPVPNIDVARSAGPGAQGVGSVSVGSRLVGAPPSIAELLTGPAASRGSSEQRRG